MKREKMGICPICNLVIDTGQPTTWRLFSGVSLRVHGTCVDPPVTRRPTKIPVGPPEYLSLLGLLDQEEWWRTRDDEWIQTESLEPGHRHRLIGWLEARAERILLAECLELDLYLEDAPDGAWNALQPALHDLEEADAMEHLNQKPLMKRLRKLDLEEFK